MRAGSCERGQIHVPVAGVTLIALLTLIAVSGILQGHAAETWKSIVRHEQELDLVFYGESYRRAIELFQRRNGRLPTSLEELCPEESEDGELESGIRYIRHCYKDPITGEEFRVIAPGEEGQRRAKNEAQRQNEEGGDDEGPLEQQGPSVSEFEYVLPGQESREQLEGEKPFHGVASTSDEEGFLEWEGTSVYSEWEFVARLPVRPPQPPQPGPGGQPGGQPPRLPQKPGERTPLPRPSPRFPFPTPPAGR